MTRVPYETIRITDSHEGQVAELLLAAPPANILSAKMMGEISRALEEQTAIARRKLLVVRGEGKHFSFGASVEEHAPAVVRDMLPGFHAMIGKLLECPVPTLARVSGQCLGGGFELAMACSLLWADETAKFAVPEIQLGVFPPVAACLLPIICGSTRATETVLLGERASAMELRATGVVSRVIESGGWDAALGELLEKQVLPKSASSLRYAHRAARASLARRYREEIGGLEKLYLDQLMATRDAVEGIQSFIEKRPARWSDC